MSKVLQMRDYALCLGMPGTGKTTTIVHIIKARERMGRVTHLRLSFANDLCMPCVWMGALVMSALRI